MHRSLSQVIILTFLILLTITAYSIGMDMRTLLGDSLAKFFMNGLLVVSLIPMLNAGLGINFGLPVGIIGGLLGMCIAINMRLSGSIGMGASMVFTVVVCTLLGWGYAWTLNLAKGREEVAGTFIGFSSVFIMNFFWTLIPFQNREMLYPLGGMGLRPKISLNNYFNRGLDDLWLMDIGEYSIPLGMILFYTAIFLMIGIYFRSNRGKRLRAVGENERFAMSNGVDIKRVRTEAVILSTILAGMGICVYSQSYGFVELYNAPMMMAFPAASAILIGGAGRRFFGVTEAVIGTFLFQTIYLLSSPIANHLLFPEISEIFRVFISNLIILYALMEVRRGKDEG